MSKIVFDDGKEVELSKEIEQNLRKVFVENKYEEYCKSNPIYVGYVDAQPKIIFSSGCQLLEIPLPNANIDWTFEVFDWMKQFCKEFPGCYPVHGYDAPDNNKALYIKLKG